MGWRGCVREDTDRRSRRERSGHYNDRWKAKRQNLDVPNQIENEDFRERLGDGVHIILVGADDNDKITCFRFNNSREVQRMVLAKEFEAEELRLTALRNGVHAHTLYSAGDSACC